MAFSKSTQTSTNGYQQPVRWWIEVYLKAPSRNCTISTFSHELNEYTSYVPTSTVDEENYIDEQDELDLIDFYHDP